MQQALLALLQEAATEQGEPEAREECLLHLALLQPVALALLQAPVALALLTRQLTVCFSLA
jgi:hypothetical protein